MILEGSVSVPAPASAVYDFLLDVDRFAACLPGVGEVTRIDDRTFDGTIAASVGPISGTFSFRARIVESNPPREMAAKVEGTDSVTKSTLNADMAMTLDPVSADQTELAYRATVDVHGRLAILGDMVLRATATLLVEEFTQRLKEHIHAGAL